MPEDGGGALRVGGVCAVTGGGGPAWGGAAGGGPETGGGVSGAVTGGEGVPTLGEGGTAGTATGGGGAAAGPTAGEGGTPGTGFGGGALLGGEPSEHSSTLAHKSHQRSSVLKHLQKIVAVQQARRPPLRPSQAKKQAQSSGSGYRPASFSKHTLWAVAAGCV